MPRHLGRYGQSQNEACRYGPPEPDLRIMGMLRWIFRLIAIAVIGKFLNQYLASRAPQLRRQEVP